MHIISGLIIAALARRATGGGQQSDSPISVFRTGPLQTLHLLPGRVRLLAPALVGDAETAARLHRTLAELDGIDNCRIDVRTGSILIRHDSEKVSAETLFGATARLIGVEDDLDEVPEPVVVRELRELGGSLNRVVHEKSGGMVDMWSGLMILLALLGIRKLLVEGRLSLPTGFTLLWWATHGMFHGNRGCM